VRSRVQLTRRRLRELLHYDPDSGEFHWRERTGYFIAAGRIAGGVNAHSGYRQIWVDGRIYPAHQLAWLYMAGRWCRPMIDHRDGDRANNRWNNLRRATRSENNANRGLQRNNRSGFKGVSLKSGKWRARIRQNGRLHSLGSFPTPQAAHAAYAAAARKLFGEFARVA
jgi:hypothetical protein